ncbi:hypothetical protein HAX54_050485 [Datura stramonium]|uniref:Uncharacterized protein n=1 Tax=Datura stramonium TaxID=4076 RepID=A0ABS8WLG2_DATST|nr:hypothetical protein [Datura stramonium]
MPLAIGLFVSLALIALCAKHGRSRKYHMADDQETSMNGKYRLQSHHRYYFLPQKQLITTISTRLCQKKSDMIKNGSNEREGFGHNEGGLWQKAILMGEKCKPPQFSGVIYYDPFGNRVSELQDHQEQVHGRSYGC